MIYHDKKHKPMPYVHQTWTFVTQLLRQCKILMTEWINLQFKMKNTEKQKHKNHTGTESCPIVTSYSDNVIFTPLSFHILGHTS